MNRDFYKVTIGRPKNEMHEKILSMRREGYSYPSIALILNVPYSTVSSACQKAKLGGRLNKEPKIFEIQNLYSKGYKLKYIATQTGVNYSTVRDICRRFLRAS